MIKPFSWLSFDQQKILFFWMFGCVAIIMVVNSFIGAPLVTSAAPMGIVSFELAGTAEQSQTILESWDETAQKWAAFGLGFDYLFMIVYACVIALGTLWASRSLKKTQWPLAGIGVWFAWGIFIAAGLDVIENVGLVAQLFWGAQTLWSRLAQICAILKFSLVFLGLVYTFYALVAYLITRLNIPNSNPSR